MNVVQGAEPHAPGAQPAAPRAARDRARRAQRGHHAVGGAAGADRAAEARCRASPRAAADAKHQIRDVDFRRGRGGEGRVIVDLSDTTTGIDIRTQGQNIVVDFLKTSLPENLRRRLDVVDFATPVNTINTFQQGENVRMVIEPRGQWEHNAYQSDTQFVLEVKPVTADPSRATQRGRYTGEKLSLNFQNVEVRAVLNVIADFTDLNIITSDTVTGNITLRLKDVPWDQALEIILQTRGLDSRRSRQRDLDRAARRARDAREARARGGAADQRPGADAYRVVPDELPEGGRRAEAAVGPGAAHPLQARQRGGRRAHQYAVRAGHAQPTRRGPPPDRADRRRRCARS